MKKSPLVTVYITNHNYGKYLKKSIESVLAQTMKDFELIIIDDGSTDNSRGIIQAYEGKKNIRTIFQKNKGLNITNNIALRSARGEFIVRLDADDYLDKNALLLMSNALKDNDEIGMVFADYYYVDAYGNVTGHERRFSFDKGEITLLDKPAHGACTMIRTKCLLDLGGYSEGYKCQDGYELWLRFIEKYKVENINLPLFYYRRHGRNLTGDETKILKTRAKIKKDLVSKRAGGKLPTLAVVPVRGEDMDPEDISLRTVGGKKILDWIVTSALGVKDIFKVVVSSPDKRVEEYVRSNYKGSRKVKFIKRERVKAQLNEGLVDTVKDILPDVSVDKYKSKMAILQLSIEYPFLESIYIQKMINTIQVFNVDSVICVRPDNNIFYKHNGHGMVPAFKESIFPKLERDYIYRREGGASLVTLKAFKKHKGFIVGRTGHIVIDPVAAHRIASNLDLEVANFLSKKRRI